MSARSTTASARRRSRERGPADGATMSLKEIAKHLGVSQARVAQILASALRKVRHGLDRAGVS